MDQQTKNSCPPVWAQPGFRTDSAPPPGDFDSPLTCGCLARAGPDPEAARTAKDTLVISENAVCCRRCGGGNLGPDPASTSPSREEPPKSEGGQYQNGRTEPTSTSLLFSLLPFLCLFRLLSFFLFPAPALSSLLPSPAQRPSLSPPSSLSAAGKGVTWVQERKELFFLLLFNSRQKTEA